MTLQLLENLEKRIHGATIQTEQLQSGTVNALQWKGANSSVMSLFHYVYADGSESTHSEDPEACFSLLDLMEEVGFMPDLCKVDAGYSCSVHMAHSKLPERKGMNAEWFEIGKTRTEAVCNLFAVVMPEVNP